MHNGAYSGKGLDDACLRDDGWSWAFLVLLRRLESCWDAAGLRPGGWCQVLCDPLDPWAWGQHAREPQERWTGQPWQRNPSTCNPCSKACAPTVAPWWIWADPGSLHGQGELVQGVSTLQVTLPVQQIPIKTHCLYRDSWLWWGGRCGETLPRAGLTSNPKKGRGWESLLWPCKASFWLWWLRISAPQREGSSIIVKCRLSIGGTHTSQRWGEERRGKASVAQPSLPRETDRPHHCPDAGVKPE